MKTKHFGLSTLLILFLLALGAIPASAASPTFTSITPASLARDTASKTLIISGTNFVDPVDVTFSGKGIHVNYAFANDASTIEVNVTIAADAAAGARDVTITNPGKSGGSVKEADAFTVNAQ